MKQIFLNKAFVECSKGVMIETAVKSAKDILYSTPFTEISFEFNGILVTVDENLTCDQVVEKYYQDFQDPF